jgi:hypothetical protein
LLFISQVRHMLVMERGSELHLCEGVPAAWVKPGDVNRLKNVLTDFGPVLLELRVSDGGKTARLTLDVPKRVRPTKVVFHLEGWSGHKAILELPTEGHVDREVDIFQQGQP